MSSSSTKEKSISCRVSNVYSGDSIDNKEYVKRGRPNTIAEKKIMRVNRKKRLRKRYHKRKVHKLEKTIENTKKTLVETERTVSRLKCMTRTFWERWKWEVEKRKELMLSSTRIGRALHASVPP